MLSFSRPYFTVHFSSGDIAGSTFSETLPQPSVTFASTSHPHSTSPSRKRLLPTPLFGILNLVLPARSLFALIPGHEHPLPLSQLLVAFVSFHTVNPQIQYAFSLQGSTDAPAAVQQRSQRKAEVYGCHPFSPRFHPRARRLRAQVQSRKARLPAGQRQAAKTRPDRRALHGRPPGRSNRRSSSLGYR